MLKRLRDEERGVAMIVSLSVAFVVLILSTVVVAQSIHSLDASGYDRERLLSVNAAEAGTNHWYAYLQSTPSVTMAGDAGCDATTGKLTIGDVVQSGPSAAAFDSVGTFYAADGSTADELLHVQRHELPFVREGRVRPGRSTGLPRGRSRRSSASPRTTVGSAPRSSRSTAPRSRTTSRSTGTAATTATSTC